MLIERLRTPLLDPLCAAIRPRRAVRAVYAPPGHTRRTRRAVYGRTHPECMDGPARRIAPFLSNTLIDLTYSIALQSLLHLSGRFQELRSPYSYFVFLRPGSLQFAEKASRRWGGTVIPGEVLFSGEGVKYNS